MLSLPGDILYAVAAGLGLVAWAFMLGYDMMSSTPPGLEKKQAVPEEPVHYQMKEAA